MVFPENYFEDEVREGFFIPSMMKRCWAAQMEVLNDIDALCRKYNIKYFADSGTLIGAVRHGGFIPWDDDLDIGMTRENYELFLEHADELPENYTVLNWRQTPEWTNAFSRVVNTTSIKFDEEFLEKYHGFFYSAGVDVFVLDYMYRDEEKEKARLDKAKLLNEIGTAIVNHGTYDVETENLISDVEENFHIYIDRTKDIPIQIFAEVESLLREVPEEDADEICLMPSRFKKEFSGSKKIIYQETVYIPFETTHIPIPIYYDEVLHDRYGDYLKVYRNGGMHDYPYYKSQEELLVKKTGWKSWNYAWNPDEIKLAEGIRGERAAAMAGIKEKIDQMETLVSSNPEIYGGLQVQLDQLKQNVHMDDSEKEEVVFLTADAEAWKNFQAIYEMEKAKPDAEVYAISIPYFDTQIDGAVIANHYVTEGYPEDVELISYDAYNLEARHPKRIYFQNPYDYANPSFTVHPIYYSNELLKYTEELIYVPYLDVYEIEPGDEKAAFCMNYYVKTPGVLHADKIILPTENLKENYIKTLVEFGGEENRPLWDHKIEVFDYRPKKNNDGAKKKILYYTNFSSFVSHRDMTIDKIRRNLDVFYEVKENVELYWMISSRTKDVLEWKCPEAYDELMELYHQYETDGWGYTITSDDDSRLKDMDAFYGEPGKLAHIANANKIPVMIQNVEC